MPDGEVRFAFDDGSWKYPPRNVRVALVAGVYFVVGIMGGLLVAALSGGSVEPEPVSILGAVVGGAMGARMELGGL